MVGQALGQRPESAKSAPIVGSDDNDSSNLVRKVRAADKPPTETFVLERGRER